MSDEKERLCGSDLLELLNTSRNPLKLAAIRNDAIQYIKENASKLSTSKEQACLDYISRFDSYKGMSDQLRDLSVWVDEINAYLDNPHLDKESE